VLCVLGFHELANVIGLSHPGEKRRTNLQDHKYFQVSKQREEHHGGRSGKQRFWIALMSFFICPLQVHIRFIDSQICSFELF